MNYDFIVYEDRLKRESFPAAVSRISHREERSKSPTVRTECVGDFFSITKGLSNTSPTEAAMMELIMMMMMSL